MVRYSKRLKSREMRSEYVILPHWVEKMETSASEETVDHQDIDGSECADDASALLTETTTFHPFSREAVDDLFSRLQSISARPESLEKLEPTIQLYEMAQLTRQEVMSDQSTLLDKLWTIGFENWGTLQEDIEEAFTKYNVHVLPPDHLHILKFWAKSQENDQLTAWISAVTNDTDVYSYNRRVDGIRPGDEVYALIESIAQEQDRKATNAESYRSRILAHQSMGCFKWMMERSNAVANDMHTQAQFATSTSEQPHQLTGAMKNRKFMNLSDGDYKDELLSHFSRIKVALVGTLGESSPAEKDLTEAMKMLGQDFYNHIADLDVSNRVYYSSTNTGRKIRKRILNAMMKVNKAIVYSDDSDYVDDAVCEIWDELQYTDPSDVEIPYSPDASESPDTCYVESGHEVVGQISYSRDSTYSVSSSDPIFTTSGTSDSDEEED